MNGFVVCLFAIAPFKEGTGAFETLFREASNLLRIVCFELLI